MAYSETPIETIEAHNRQVNSALDSETGDFVFRVLMRSFEFEKALMQEHFNEKYVESDKYPKAQFKGSGTVNGSGDYGFMLTAIDGQLNGGGGTDKFRIKIWDRSSNDEILYDNKMDAPDGDDPTTELRGGNIVIHKK